LLTRHFTYFIYFIYWSQHEQYIDNTFHHTGRRPSADIPDLHPERRRQAGGAGLPLATLGYAAAVIVELGGGLLLLAGYQTRIVASVLAVFSIITALVFHHAFGDQNQMIHFMKNLAMAGGLLQVASFGAGAFSLDGRSGKLSRQAA